MVNLCIYHTSFNPDVIFYVDYPNDMHTISDASLLWLQWRHPMDTFSVLLDRCEGNSPVTGEFPAQTGSFDVFIDLRLNKRLSKHSWG